MSILNDNCTERIHINTILYPENGNPGVMKTKILSFDEEKENIYQNPITYNFYIVKNTDVLLDFIYKNENYVPFDITGYTAIGTAVNLDDPNITFDLHPTITDYKNGIITLNLPKSETKDIFINETRELYKYFINIVNEKCTIRITVGIITVCQ